MLVLVQLNVVINDLEKGLSTLLGESADGAQLFMALGWGHVVRNYGKTLRVSPA